MDKKVKVLCFGNVCGKFGELQSKLRAINDKHGPFDLALCAGDFFSTQTLEESGLTFGHLSMPIPTYFITGRTKMPDDYIRYAHEHDGQIAPNLMFLGRGCRFNERQAEDYSLDFYDNSDVRALCGVQFPPGTVKGVDILVTYEWPTQIADLSNVTAKPTKCESRDVSSVVTALLPRYHFAAAEGHFYEREPFTNEHAHSTRFIGLGDLGNTQKERWFYAFNVAPMVNMTPSVLNAPADKATENPLVHRKKRQNDNKFFENETGDATTKRRNLPDGYVCKICQEKGHHIRDCPRKGTRDPNLPPADYICHICKEGGHFIKDCPRKQKAGERDMSCWFCLSNPKLEKHLIVAIGEEVYLTLPKGELVKDHLLIVPIDHVPNTLCITSQECRAEIERFQGRLRKYFDSIEMDMLILETNFRSQHLNIQIFPIPRDLSPNLPEQYRAAASVEGFEFIEYDDNLPESLDQFFRVEFPTGEHLLLPIEGFFNVQFGRRILANLLDIPDRSDWKACVKSMQDETNDANAFKKAFKDF